MDSTSGGVFSVLAQYVLERDGFVFGAEFDASFNVVHGYGKTSSDLARFRGSKYVQSNLGDTLKKVRELLDQDYWVLFSGTPCQIEGLYSFLGKKYEKLVLMDIVCYSISSPGVWRRYLEHLENMKRIDLKEVKKIKFRDKSKFGYEYTFMSFYDKAGKLMYSSGPESNQMLRSFVSNTVTRPACYNCSFKKVDRVSDFTVWDCYNVYQYDKKLDDNKGTSHIMVHNDRALSILMEMENELKLIEVDREVAVNSEPAMTTCASPSEMRENFFTLFKAQKNPFDIVFPDKFRIKTERVLRTVLSQAGVYKYIKRLLKR